MSADQHSHRLPPAANTNRGDENKSSSGFWTSKAGLATIGFLLIGAFLLLSEHRAHALGLLPYLLLLACPLMHLFMHGGHGEHGGHGGRERGGGTKHSHEGA